MMKNNHDAKVSSNEKPVLTKGQPVYFRTLKNKWEPAIVQEHAEPRSYVVKNLETSIAIRRNRQQLKPNTCEQVSDNAKSEIKGTPQTQETAIQKNGVDENQSKLHDGSVECPAATPQREVSVTPQVRTRSGRIVRNPFVSEIQLCETC